MNGKKTMYSEAAYVIGLVILALGAAFMERANYGMSMVVAPAYLVYLKVSETLSWFTFGMAEYSLQAVLVLGAIIVWRQFKWKYLFSFVTAVIYGFILDGMMALVALIPGDGTVFRLSFYVLGMLFSSYGVSMLFHTYFAPEAYELLVKEISERYSTNINKTKTIYDIISCLVAVILSFAFFGFGHFEGVKLGTIFCALVNGTIIGLFSRWNEAMFDFRDALKLKRLFE